MKKKTMTNRKPIVALIAIILMSLLFTNVQASLETYSTFLPIIVRVGPNTEPSPQPTPQLTPQLTPFLQNGP